MFVTPYGLLTMLLAFINGEMDRKLKICYEVSSIPASRLILLLYLACDTNDSRDVTFVNECEQVFLFWVRTEK